MSEAAEKSEPQQGYKQVVIGPSQVAVPDHWRVRKLGDVTDIVSGNTPKKSNQDYWGGDIVWITPTDVTDLDGKYMSDSKEKITEEGLANSSASLIEPSAVLMTSRATIGEVVINEVPVTTNQGFKTLVPNEDLDREYLYYYISSIKQYLNAIGGGSTFSEISKRDVSSIKIPVPPLSEQHRIADILSTVDEQIQQTDEIIETTLEVKDAVANRLFEEGVRNAEREPVKLGPKSVSLPKSWDVTKLTNLDSPEENAVQTGPYQLGDVEFKDSGLRVYGQSNVTSDDYDSVNNHISEDLEEEFSRYKIKGDDVLLTRMGTVGDASLFPSDAQPGILSYHLLRIRPDQTSCWSPYLHHVLNDGKIVMDQIKSLSHGSIMDGLNVSTIRQVRIPMPPLEEQKEISQILRAFDRKIKQERQSKEELQDLKRGLMQDLLTGQVRVNQDN
jgi:type I restriction enzyme S subunit